MCYLQSVLSLVKVSPCREHELCPSLSFLLAGSAAGALEHWKSECQWLEAAQKPFITKELKPHSGAVKHLSMVPSGEQSSPSSTRLLETPGAEGAICVVFMHWHKLRHESQSGSGLFVKAVDKFGFRTFSHSAQCTVSCHCLGRRLWESVWHFLHTGQGWLGEQIKLQDV